MNGENNKLKLDEIALEMLANLNSQLQSIATARDVMLTYFARKNGRNEKWKLSEDGKELTFESPLNEIVGSETKQ